MLTFRPAWRVRNPEPVIARKCTNTSGPFSRLMNPKPLLSLNHLTVPTSRSDISTPQDNSDKTRAIRPSRLTGMHGNVGDDGADRRPALSGHNSQATVQKHWTKYNSKFTKVRYL